MKKKKQKKAYLSVPSCIFLHIIMTLRSELLFDEQKMVLTIIQLVSA